MRNLQDLEYEKVDKVKTYVSTLKSNIEDLELRMGRVEGQYEDLEVIQETRRELKRKATELEESLEDLAQRIHDFYG